MPILYSNFRDCCCLGKFNIVIKTTNCENFREESYLVFLLNFFQIIVEQLGVVNN